MRFLITLSFLLYPFTLMAQYDPFDAESIEVETQRNKESFKRIENHTGQEIRVYHPNAEKGLVRITSDGEYIYKVEESPQEAASSVRFGIMSLSSFSNPDDTSVTFSDIYDAEVPVLIYEHEWQFTERFGKLAAQVSTGLITTQGNGILSNLQIEAEESFTFLGFPTSANLIYRLKYWEKQWLVPYLSGGAGVLAFAEVRDDGGGTKIGGAYYGFGAGGLAFSLNAMSPTAAVMMDREYGINDTWIVAEFRVMAKLAGQFDVSSNFVNAGLLVEF